MTGENCEQEGAHGLLVSTVFRHPDVDPHRSRARPALAVVIVMGCADVVSLTGRERQCAEADSVMRGLLFPRVGQLASRYRALGLEPFILAGSHDAAGSWEDFCWEHELDGLRVCDRRPGRTLWEDILALTRGDGIVLHPGSFPLVRESGLRLLLREAGTVAANAALGRRAPAGGHPVACLRPCSSLRKGWPALVRREAVAALACSPQEASRLLDGARLVDVADDNTAFDVLGEAPLRVEERASRLGRLTPAEALRLLGLRGLPERAVRHDRAVGRVAQELVRAVLAARPDAGLDPDLALAAGFVHDIAKGYRHHEQVGGWWLSILGLPDLARCVRDHRDLVLDGHQPVTERELVYLADKYCHGPFFVPLAERFGAKMALYPDNPAALAGIRRRLAHAQHLEARLAREFGFSAAAVAREALSGAPARVA